MNHALEILSALEHQFSIRVGGYPIRWYTGILSGPDYHLSWKYGDRRCGEQVLSEVLVIESLELAEEIRRTGIVTELVTRILEGDPAPRIPLKAILFQECGPDLSRLLERLNFHRNPVGNTADYWHLVTGQKELPL